MAVTEMAPDFTAFGADDQQRQAAERLAVVGLERLHGGGVAVVHRGDPAGAVHLEVHQVVGQRAEVAVLVLDPHGDEREIVAVGGDRPRGPAAARSWRAAPRSAPPSPPPACRPCRPTALSVPGSYGTCHIRRYLLVNFPSSLTFGPTGSSTGSPHRFFRPERLAVHEQLHLVAVRVGEDREWPGLPARPSSSAAGRGPSAPWSTRSGRGSSGPSGSRPGRRCRSTNCAPASRGRRRLVARRRTESARRGSRSRSRRTPPGCSGNLSCASNSASGTVGPGGRDRCRSSTICSDRCVWYFSIGRW